MGWLAVVRFVLAEVAFHEVLGGADRDKVNVHPAGFPEQFDKRDLVLEVAVAIDVQSSTRVVGFRRVDLDQHVVIVVALVDSLELLLSLAESIDVFDGHN